MNALRRASVPAWNATRVAAAPRAPPTTLALPKRRMGGGGGGRPYDDKHGPYHGHFHVSKWHEYPAIAYCTVMWLWMMYRAKQDGAWVLGIIHPWDAH